MHTHTYKQKHCETVKEKSFKCLVSEYIYSEYIYIYNISFNFKYVYLCVDMDM